MVISLFSGFQMPPQIMHSSKIRLFFFVLLLYGGQAMAQNAVVKANEFLATLTPELRSKTLFPLEDGERFNWHFVPLERKGTSFRDYSEKQSTAAWSFLNTCVGEQGYAKAKGITELEFVLMELSHQAPDNHYRDPLNYHFFIFGTPSNDQPWAWRFEGHHISISMAFDRGKLVSSTPSFFGSNPGIVQDGAQKGKEVLKRETDLGFSLVNSFDASQLKAALLDEQAPAEILSIDKQRAGALADGGIYFTQLSDVQKKLFLQLLAVYLSTYELGFSADLEKKIRVAGIDKLTFGWAGSRMPGIPNYYRIQGPTLLIEYDNTQNNANHVHTVVRDLTNDFAGDILKEHYLKDHTK